MALGATFFREAFEFCDTIDSVAVPPPLGLQFPGAVPTPERSHGDPENFSCGLNGDAVLWHILRFFIIHHGYAAVVLFKKW